MAQISQFPPTSPDDSQARTLGSLALQPDPETGTFSLPDLIAQWQTNPDIKAYLEIISQQADNVTPAFFTVGDQTVSRENILGISTPFFAAIKNAINSDPKLKKFLTSNNPKAIQLQGLLARQFPYQTKELVKIIDGMVQTTNSILPELDLVTTLTEQAQAETTTDTDTEPEKPVELNSAKVVTQPSAPTPLPADDISTDFITAAATPAYQKIAIFNGYAKNKIGFMLLQQYGITAESGNPWDYLSPQLQYQLENKLRTYVFSLDDEQFKNLNRQQFTQAFFEQFRQDSFALLRPAVALRPEIVEQATSQPSIPLATDSEAEPAEIPDIVTPEDAQLDHAHQEVKNLTQGHFFTQNMKQIEDRLVTSLTAKGLSSVEAQGMREFADMVPAVGEDLHALMMGANRTQLVSMFPFLSKYDDTAILTIVHDLRNYSSHQQGLLMQVTGAPAKDLPLLTPEAAEALANPDTGLGQVVIPNHAERLLDVINTAQEVGPQNGMAWQIVQETSAVETRDRKNPVYVDLMTKVIGPLQHSSTASDDANDLNAEKYLSGIRRHQDALYERLFNEMQGKAKEAATYLEKVENYYAQQDELRAQQTAAMLSQWKESMLQTEFGQQVSNYYLNNVAHTRLGQFASHVYDWKYGDDGGVAGAPGSGPSSPNVLKLYQQLRQKKKAVDTANQAKATKEAISKTKFLSKMLIQAKKTMDSVKSALGLTRVVIFVQGLVSGLLGALAPLLPILAPAAGLLIGLTAAFPQLAGSLLSAAQSIFSPFASSTMQQFGVGSPATAASTPGTTAASNAQPGALGKMGQAAKELFNPSSTLGTTTLSIGGAAAFTGTVLMTTNTLQGAFYKPLNLRGEVSPYVNIVKTATVNGTAVTELATLAANTTVTYTITITPEPGYLLTIAELADSRSVIFNTAKLQADGRTAPAVTNTNRTYETAEGGTQHPEFADDLTAWGNKPELAEGNVLTLTYNELLTPEFLDSNVNNSFSLTFDVTPTTGKELGAKGEVATMNHSICIGECPELSGGCWPVDGIISQFPFDDDEPDGSHNHGYSHSPGGMDITPKGQDAFDISQNGGQEITAPFAGRLCSRPYDANGYGTYVVLDQISGTEQYGPNFQLHFAHMSRSTFGSVAGIQCKQVNVGDVLGVVGNSGNSGGYHLHYAASPVIASYESRIREIVTLTSSAAIGTKISTQGPLCQKTGL